MPLGVVATGPVEVNSAARKLAKRSNSSAGMIKTLCLAQTQIMVPAYPDAARFRTAWGSWYNQRRLHRRKSSDRVRSVRLGDASALADQG